MNTIRATVLGLHDLGVELCAAVHGDASFELVAVADTEKSLAESLADRYGAQAFDDYRSAIVEPDPQVVFFAIPPYQRVEYLKLAASRALGVYVTGPALTSLEGCVEYSRMFASADVPLCVFRYWQNEPAYRRLREPESWAGRLFSANVNVISPGRDLQGWRGDSVRSGGGALMYGAYDQVDSLVSIFGMPEEVYTVLSTVASVEETRPYDTEDAATLLMRFSKDRVATVNCRRIGSEYYWRYRLHGTLATALLTPEEMVVSDVEGRAPVSSRVKTRNRFVCSVAGFSAALTSGAKMASAIGDHLKTMAVIKTGYLSAKTGQPESPSRLYTMETGLEVGEASS